MSSDTQHHPAHEHVIPLPVYFAVYGALLVLTVATVAVSYADLGAASIYAAMLVAMIKAGLVVAYFMHLRYDAGFNALVFLVSLMFLLLFFSFTMVDIATRDSISATEGNFTLLDARAAANAKAAAAAASTASTATASNPATPASSAPPSGAAAMLPSQPAASEAAPAPGASASASPDSSSLSSPAAPASSTNNP